MADLADYGSVRTNLARLRQDNSERRTQRELGREISDNARAKGMDTSQAVGRRRPTETWTPEGGWVKSDYAANV